MPDYVYPWQESLRQAILELDPAELQKKITVCEVIIYARVQEIDGNPGGIDERIALNDGLVTLATLKRLQSKSA